MSDTSGKIPTEYIQHHLHHWTIGSGSMTLNLDTVMFSVIAGGVILFIAWWVGRRITVDKPGRIQNVLEMIVTFVNTQVQEAFPVRDPFIGPMALTIFLWVAMMNAYDLVPVDLIPWIAGHVGGAMGKNPAHVYMHLLPTADLDTTFGLSLSVFVLTLIYGIRAKGVGGYFKRFLTHPYGPYMVPINLAMSLVEELARPISLALRLWGNMFAGDLIFMLIALFGFSLWVAPGQVAMDWAWTWFETLEVILQAFIFMLLSIVYLSMAVQEDEH